CETGFSIAAYLRAKVTAEFDAREDRDLRSTESGEVPRDTPHPELYARLLEWRRDIAEELDSALHEVLPKRSLQELVRVLPADKASLKQITGVGKRKLKRFGDDLISVIARYCAEKNIVAKTANSREPSKGNTKQVSFDLYKSGKTIAEIAA